MAAIVDEVIYGVTLSTGEKWVGISPAVITINKIPTELDKKIDPLVKIFDNSSWLDTDAKNL